MSHLKPLFFVLLLAIFSMGCSKKVILTSVFDTAKLPTAPDYANADYWAALPNRADNADRIPSNCSEKDNQATAEADVFFIHPTTFTQKPAEGQYEWNADVNDVALNARTDGSTILNQATPFNGTCRVFAPRYRQAHLYAFSDKDAGTKALWLAYSDVKAAFEYYLKHYNNGRPIVIASHSQGTVHAKQLLKELFDGKPLQKQLVFAYLIGIKVQPTDFKTIKAATSPEEVGGYASWNTFARDYYPTYYADGYATSIVTNPLTWQINETFAPKELNKGAVGRKFDFIPQAIDAEVHKGMLWINKPYIRGRFLIRTKIWHIADINFFWQNIRENVALRTKTFLNQK
jgi:hypothetical protein